MIEGMSNENPGYKAFSRHAEGLVKMALADTPVVLIQGARQVGKSTLATQVLAGTGARLLTLDTHSVLSAAQNDPDSFVRQNPDSLLAIDEVQRAPELLRAVKAVVDEQRRPGQFLLTGSADLLRIPGQHESLAGRAETIPLFGLSQGEIRSGKDDLASRLFSGDEIGLNDFAGTMSRDEYLEIICEGSYPEPRLRSGRRRQAWFDNYLSRIVDRDAKDISRLMHLDRLPRLMRLLAANNSGELVKSRFAKGIDLPETSISGYLELLASLYLIHFLPAWGGNLTQRVIGRPKLSLLDSGLAARLSNLSVAAFHPGSATAHHAGGLTEAFVTGEIRRQSTWAPNRFEMFHFRDRSGREVDLVLEDDARNIVGLEVKSSATVQARDFAGLEYLSKVTGPRFKMGVVLYMGKAAVRFGPRLWALPLSALWI